MRLNADATLDRSYGVDGIAETPINEACGSLCTSAALQPDGSLVLAGSTGEVPAPPAPAGLHWALTRLTPSGSVDPGFGTGGVATIPTPGSTTGMNVALGAGGTIVSDAQAQVGASSKMLLTRLTAAGAPDPSFAGGTPIDVPVDPGFLMLAQDDGAIVLDGRTPGSTTATSNLGHSLLVRYAADGTRDSSFGSSGIVDLGTTVHPNQLLPISGRAVLVVGASGPHLNLKLVTVDGLFAPLLGGAEGRDVDPAFGGGGSSFLVSVKPRPVASVAQNSFLDRGDTTVVRRADGSLLVAGGVRVSQPTGEGAGYSIGRFAAAALTPSLAVDPTFGGPAAKPKLSVKLSLQRASTARTRHGIRVQVKASQTGLTRVKITHDGRAIAYSLLPIFKTTSHTIPVELTSYGNTYLRNHRNVRVSITANGRDLLASPMKTSARRPAALDRAGRLAPALRLARAQRRADDHQDRAGERDVPAPAELDLPGRVARAIDDADVEHDADREDREHGRELAARPRQLVVAGDDVGEDERRDRDDQQQPAQDRVDLPGAVIAEAVQARDLRQPADGAIPRREQAATEQHAAEHGHELVARQARHQWIVSATATSCSSVHGPWPVRRRNSPSWLHASSCTGRSSGSASSSGAVRCA